MLDWVPFPNLRRLKLEGLFSSLPTWICSSSLPLLSYLDLTTSGEVQSGAIEILGMLPALRYVNFSVSMFREVVQKLVVSIGAFPEVRVCLLHRIVLVNPTFQQGAMPMVQRLRSGVQVKDIVNPYFDLSIWDFPSLQQLRIDLLNKEVGPEDYSQAVNVLRCVANDHPKNPTVHADKYFRMT
ncbi:unnamed protein product [Triticum turgidum subsp. durum]|uniref:Disease resistance R13L4/SHOC-2-like LRR domain-containing protein n=1 Tax=Triticum turgidum subsp. durum TaxID=4567 RepID=A0A9R1PA51_TRITD|nr:unnamed protein product [Triticum turgidum subsp. durum]